MANKKTSIIVDEKIWKEFIEFTVRKYGNTRKISKELENILRDYLGKQHSIE